MELYLKSIALALNHIRTQQSPDGSFVNLSGFLVGNFSSAIPRRTTFFTSNILSCLKNVPGNTGDIQSAAAKFLLTERSPQWTFNYWAREQGVPTEIHLPPYPDDLDDTFAALAALAQYDHALIDGHVASAITKMLTAREVQVGGPYRTWLVGEDVAPAWQDIDPVVNSTIGYMLSLLAVRLPHLERFINDIVEKGRCQSPYYPGIFQAAYFLSRFYSHSTPDANIATRSTLANMVIAELLKNDDRIANALEYAMAISALFNLGHAERIPRTLPDALSSTCDHEGFLPYAFCVDPSRGGKRCYAGSSALTAAFCAEALAKCIAMYASSTRTLPTTHDDIILLARTRCRALGPELAEEAIAQIEKISDEKITAVAYAFQSALYRRGKIIPTDIAEQLSLANLLGWMAYTIYDDVIDGDGGSDLIPCANFFLHSLTEIYQAIAKDRPEIAALFQQTMNCIDHANAWEQKYCRIDVNKISLGALPGFDDLATLADRSIGHAMGPLAELLYAGYTPDSAEYKSTESFFRHYLIARQLHDDAHDWADDLLRGRMNSVSAIILQYFKEQHPAENATIEIDTILPALRKIFWEVIADSVASLIASHTAEARKVRVCSSVLSDADFMEDALRALESGAGHALKERDETLIFLNDYRASRPYGA